MCTHQWVRRANFALAISGVLALGSCGGDSGTGPGAAAISQAEVLALTNAISSVATVAPYASIAPIALGLAGSVGSVGMAPVLASTLAAAVAAVPGLVPRSAVAGDYRAVGVLVNFNIAPPGSPTTVLHVFTLLGWNGVNVVAQTVDNILFVGSVGLTSVATTGAGFGSTIGGSGDGGGAFITRAPGKSYTATGGAFNVSSWSSSGSRSCSQPVPGVGSIICQAATGQMTGSFSLVGAPAVGTGSVAFPVTTFTGVPLVVLTMSLAP